MNRLGLKINCSLVKDKLSIEAIVKNIVKTNEYIIGKDTQYCDHPHYHIHWLDSRKQQTVSSAKSTWFSKLHKEGIDTGGKSTQCYQAADTGEPLNKWWGYAIKEHEEFNTLCVDERDYSAIKAYADSCLKNKIYNWNIRQKKVAQEDAKKDLKKTIRDYVGQHLEGGRTAHKIELCIMQLLRNEGIVVTRNKLQTLVVEYLYSLDDLATEDILEYIKVGHFTIGGY